MADRAGDEGDPVVPKQVVELDKDERWQARLEEARARREVALREKAAGKPQQPRPKPWEVEGAAVEAPPNIDPIIQERGDDKFDFADRLETIRDAKGKAKQEPAAEAAEASEPVSEAAPSEQTPDVVRPKPAETTAARASKTVTSSPASDREGRDEGLREVPPPEPLRDMPPPRRPETPLTVAKSSAPEPRARPQPSLILPGAPDVAELAARYAATLETAEDLRFEDIGKREPKPEPEEPARTATLVPLPTAAKPPVEVPLAAAPSRVDRRRGIRPLGMAFALVAFAVLPLTTEAPPLETGPDMPVIDIFRIQPALGVTWSLGQVPVQTNANAWRPRPGPSRLTTALAPFAPPPGLYFGEAALTLPVVTPSGVVDWSEVRGFAAPSPPALATPEAAPLSVPEVSSAPAPLNLPSADTVEPTTPAPNGAVSAPPRPATIENNGVDALPPTPAARPDQTVVEADPLRVTILAPSRADRTVAEEIASDVQNVGHELVRVKDVDFSISSRNVRYFHEDDRAAAERMADRYDAELRDFTWFRPRPVEGTAELWLAGRAPSSGAQAPADGDFIGRVLERLGLGTELPVGPTGQNAGN